MIFLIAASVGFVLTTLYGLYAGFAPPSTALIRLVEPLDLGALDPFIPFVFLVIAACGAGSGWQTRHGKMPAARSYQIAIGTGLRWKRWGLLIVFCLLLFSLSSGGWSGHLRPVEISYLSLAGFVPYSDAQSYFADAIKQALWGEWGTLGSRRPLAEAFRHTIIFAAQYSYLVTLVIQAALVAAALFFAAWSLAQWRGIWTALAFVGFILILIRPFLTTMMTEPLGLVWCLFSLVFFIEALRWTSLAHAIVGLTALTLALFTRMGSLLTIPAMVLWITFAFGHSNSQRLRNFALASCAVLAVIALSTLLTNLYATSQTTTGNNFAWTICGLSLGTDWGGCQDTYAAPLFALPNERAQAWFLFARAWDNIVQQPQVTVMRLIENAAKFLVSQPRAFIPGFEVKNWWARATAVAATLALMPLLWVVWRNRMPSLERSFWVTLGLSMVASAAIIFADDGWRAMHVTHVFAACFLALGFTSNPTLETAPLVRWQTGAAILTTAMVLFVAAPWLSHLQMKRTVEPTSLNGNDHVIIGGRALTGFLVVPDGAPRAVSVPTLRVSEFTRLVEASKIETTAGPFATELAARAPFALVLGVRLDDRGETSLYAASPDILKQSAVRAWRLAVRPRGPTDAHWHGLFEASTTEPIR